jgi:hypothetical protein
MRERRKRGPDYEKFLWSRGIPLRQRYLLTQTMCFPKASPRISVKASTFSSWNLRPTICTPTWAPSYISGSSTTISNRPQMQPRKLTSSPNLLIRLTQWFIPLVHHINTLINCRNRQHRSRVIKQINPHAIAWHDSLIRITKLCPELQKERGQQGFNEKGDVP